MLAPLVDATGFNNELERPHLRVFDGRYYLFWSTQAQVFAPDAGAWPTGLCAFAPFARLQFSGERVTLTDG